MDYGLLAADTRPLCKTIQYHRLLIIVLLQIKPATITRYWQSS